MKNKAFLYDGTVRIGASSTAEIEKIIKERDLREYKIITLKELGHSILGIWEIWIDGQNTGTELHQVDGDWRFFWAAEFATSDEYSTIGGALGHFMRWYAQKPAE